MVDDDADSKADGELEVGYVAGAHGVRGAVRVRLFDPDSDTLAAGRELVLRDEAGAQKRRAHISRVAPQPGSDRVRVWLEGVDQREQAEALKGLAVHVSRDGLPELEEDEYYLADLIGAPVVRMIGDRAQPLGEIVGVTSNGVQDLFEVEWQRRGKGASIWLLPALPEFIAEIESDRVLVDLPREFLPTELERGDGD